MTQTARASALRGWAVDLGIATAGGLFLGVIGPFGSYLNGPLWQRAGFQVTCFSLGMLVYGTAARLLLRRGLPTRALVLATILMVAVVTAPFSILVAALARALWPFLSRLSLLEWYWQGLAVAEPVVLAMTFLIRRRERTADLRREAAGQPVARDPAQAILGVAPGEVLCLQMEDHYVRVRDRRASRLVLTTFSQAIAALGDVDGMQVHRSWWIARAAVARAEIEGRNLRLHLVDGTVAPVARSAVSAVRAAGWIDATS